MTLTFTVPGLPRAKERARKGKYGNMYTPRKTASYEAEIWACAQERRATQGMFGDRPVWVSLRVYMHFPRRPNSHNYPTVKPDFDNVLKAFLDGMKPAWKDDAQVVGILGGSGKFYSLVPHVEMVVTDEAPDLDQLPF